MPHTAQFHGVCSECTETIAPGQRIEHDSVEQGWRHTNCHQIADSAPCVCARCFLVHVGEC